VLSVVTEKYSSTAPIKLGPYAIKFLIRAAPGTPPTTNTPITDDFLREELADRLRKQDLWFDFLVQFYVDEKLTPIEDTSIPWPETHSPLIKTAQLRIPQCDLDRDPAVKALSEKVERLAFTPWHATEDHRPLGSIMRARRVAYGASSALRGHNPEPSTFPF